MPLPTPSKGESKDKFISRCMSNSTMKEDFPTQSQRLAVCHSQFKKSKSLEDEMETKTFDLPFEICSSDEGEGTFEGHASIFNKADEFGDVILPGAFKKSLKSHPKKRVKMLREHNRSALIGAWTEIKEDDKGLFVKGRLLMDIQAAAETFILMKEGILDSMSIGFRTVIDQFDSEKKVRNLIELKLFEISVVTFPAQLAALVTSVKQMGPEELRSKKDLEKALRYVGFSESTSKYICAGWTPPAQRDVEGGDDELVSDIRRLTESMLTATGVAR